MSEKIHFILTGGTIDGFYDAVEQTSKPQEQSVIPDYLENTIKPYLDLSFETVCMKDSKDITNEDNQAMLEAIKNSDGSKFIVTHGTDTMEITAKFLKDNLGETNKIVVMTGSLIPLKGFTRSDSGFNLGFALAEIQHLSPGIYIAMHGKVFEAGSVAKNHETARFETKAS